MGRKLYISIYSVVLAIACLLASAPALAGPPEQAEPPLRPIELDAGPETDRAIEERLRSIYAELESLQNIEVEVAAGVVHLGGEVHSLEAVREAEAIAKRAEGVAAVTTSIQQESKISRRLVPVFEQMGERVKGWLSYLPLVVIAFAAVVLAWALARTLARRSRRNAEPDTFSRQLMGQLVRGSIVALGIAIALELLGARGLLGAMIGTASVLGIVLGIAFKNIGEAYIASILLSMRRPFAPHDSVLIDEVEGTIVRLSSRATLMMTFDGNLVSIPNSTVFGATIINFTRNPQRRFRFKVGVPFEADLRQVQELAVATLANVPGVLSEPKPTCLVDEFGETGMVIIVAGWVNQRQSDWLKVSSEAKRRIKVAFDRGGIDVSTPILHIRCTLVQSEAEAPEPQAEALEPQANSVLDVSPDDHIDRQVDQERASSGEGDLLRHPGERGD